MGTAQHGGVNVFGGQKNALAESGASPNKQLLIHSTVMALQHIPYITEVGDYCSTISVFFTKHQGFFCST